MKIKSAALATGIATAAMAFSLSPVLADSPGQLGGGADVYKVKDLTKSGSYSNAVTAACGDELQYSIRLHNAAFGGLTNIEVTADLAAGSFTAVPAEGASAGTSGSVSVTVPSGANLAYEAGSTTLFDANGNVIKTLPDTITSGVNVGNLNGSTTEFVNFKAKVNCPTTPPVTPPTTPQPLPQTGVEGAGLAGMAGTGAVGYAVMAYRRSKKALAQTLLNRK
jgi:hypothetical protein